MTIRIRILALLALLSLIFGGTAFLIHHLQAREGALLSQVRERELGLRLQRLVSSTSRPAYRYLRNYSGRAAMVEFLSNRDPAWAEKYIKGRMDLYRIDTVWVLNAEGKVIYGMDRPTESDLAEPPLPAKEMQALFQRNSQFNFFAPLSDSLYQIQGMPIVAMGDLDRQTPALGWLVVAQHWGQPVLDDMSDAGQGRVGLTPPSPPPDIQSGQELKAWIPLLNQQGRPVAGLDYRVPLPNMERNTLEFLEHSVYLIGSGGAIILMGVLMHLWILRPFTVVRTSLITRDQSLLAPLLIQRNEFGQMARVVRSSMRDREHLQQSLEERIRLGSELHDGAIQGVYGAGMALTRVQSLMGKDLAAANKLLDETRVELNHIIAELRRHIEKVDPKPVDTPFGEAVARLIAQLHGPGPVCTELNIDEQLVARHGSLHRSQALQFVREAVSNALRHGHPTCISVLWQSTPEGSKLVVADDGVGFKPEDTRPGGRGLGNLGERAVSLGGHLEIDSGPDLGTRISVYLPPPKSSP